MSALVLSCVVPGEPVAKERPRFAVAKVTHKPIVYTPAETKRHEARIAQYATTFKAQRVTDEHACVSVDVDFYVSQLGHADIDNLAKCVLDGLNGSGIWVDDRQVVTVMARKFAAVPGSTEPHTRITVQLVSDRIELAKRKSRRKAA